MRRSALLVVLLALTAVVAGAVAARPSSAGAQGTSPTQTTPSTQTAPLQGLYEECPPAREKRCARNLRQIGAGGFKLVINYEAWYGSARKIRAYARAAAAHGIKLIWPVLSAPWRNRGRLAVEYRALAHSCHCKTNRRLFRYAIRLVRHLPATWGYYVGDQLAPRRAREVSALAAHIRALDPSHQLLYIGSWSPSVSHTLPPFLHSADVVGADVYPIGLGEPPSEVASVAAAVAQMTSKAGRQSAIVLQSFSWSQYPKVPSFNAHWPTVGDMQEMLSDALSSNPAIVLWYSFHDIQRSHHPKEHWRELLKAAFGSPSASQPG